MTNAFGLPTTIASVEDEVRRQAAEWQAMTGRQRNEHEAAMERITRRLESQLGFAIKSPRKYWCENHECNNRATVMVTTKSTSMPCCEQCAHNKRLAGYECEPILS